MNIKEFFTFVRQQGVIGLAVGFILGGSVNKVVTSLVADIVDPILGLLLGTAGNLKDAKIVIGAASIKWGNFLSTFIDFLVIAFVVFIFARLLKLESVEKKK